MKITREDLASERYERMSEKCRTVCERCRSPWDFATDHCSNREKCRGYWRKEPSCGRCQVVLHPAPEFFYAASAPDHDEQFADADARICPECKRVFVDFDRCRRLDETVASLPHDFDAIPDAGYSTDELLEVEAPFDWDEDTARVITKETDYVTVRFDKRSSLFERSRPFFQWNPRYTDSFTLQIQPPPPYSRHETATIHLLLTQIELELDGDDALTAHDAFTADLFRMLIEWPKDADRRALVLAYAIRHERHPGIFVNAYRLLELVIGCLLDSEIAEKRRDPRVYDGEFRDLVRLHGKDLKFRLKRCVEALTEPPTQILDNLWHHMHPDETLNRPAIFERLAKFRNQSVHPPDPEQMVSSLPWETPDYEAFAYELLGLIGFIVKDDLKRTATPTKLSVNAGPD